MSVVDAIYCESMSTPPTGEFVIFVPRSEFLASESAEKDRVGFAFEFMANGEPVNLPFVKFQAGDPEIAGFPSVPIGPNDPGLTVAGKGLSFAPL
mgnify:CR=1 FL=1